MLETQEAENTVPPQLDYKLSELGYQTVYDKRMLG
jgi:hypothetical protein